MKAKIDYDQTQNVVEQHLSIPRNFVRRSDDYIIHLVFCIPQCNAVIIYKAQVCVNVCMNACVVHWYMYYIYLLMQPATRTHIHQRKLSYDCIPMFMQCLITNVTFINVTQQNGWAESHSICLSDNNENTNISLLKSYSNCVDCSVVYTSDLRQTIEAKYREIFRQVSWSLWALIV